MKKLSFEDIYAIRGKYRALVDSGNKIGAVTKLAEEYDVSRWTIQDIIAKRKSYSEETVSANPKDAGGIVKGRSILYDPQGNIKLEWVKTINENDIAFFRKLFDELKEGLPVFEPVEPQTAYSTEELLAVYPMGDPHFGMYSWAEETGTDFDLNIAENDLCSAVESLVNSAPSCPKALIVNLGDFFHADTMDGTTWRSKNKLDVDTRWLKVLRTGIRAIIRCVECALQKHEEVDVICAIGNHDDHTSMMLMTILTHIFSNEPRVFIYDSPTIKHYYRHGKVLLGVHHGHTIKMAELPMQMATDKPTDWGETLHKYWLTGHIHHDSKKEFNGVIVESFRTLAGRDAWHAQQGYNSGRDMKCILFHSEYGEVARHTVSVQMLRSAPKPS